MESKRVEGGRRTLHPEKHRVPGLPLISVITVVFNRKTHLEETIRSILEQTYPNLEYIIVDGGSNDGTLDIIKKYNDRIDYWVSEKDRGISDAFNKGVRLSLGDYLNFQGDGDGFLDRNSVERLFRDVNSETHDLVSGRIRRLFADGTTLDSPERKFKRRHLLFKMPMPHQGLFTHRRFFEKYGLFDEKCRFAMDYDHLLRAYHDFPPCYVSPQVVARWRDDGIGSGRTRLVLKEYDEIKRRNRVAPGYWLHFIAAWSRLKFEMRELLR